jgi:hypothetical protein
MSIGNTSSNPHVLAFYELMGWEVSGTTSFQGDSGGGSSASTPNPKSINASTTTKVTELRISFEVAF